MKYYNKIVYKLTGATFYKKPVGYVKSNPLHTKDKLPEAEDWSKKSALSPLGKKAYMTGNPGGPHKLSSTEKKSEIKSRKDYHEASKHFHEGRVDHLIKQRPKQGSPEADQLKFHQTLANHHDNAFATVDPTHMFHNAYPKHLENIQKTYGDMEKHATKHGIQTGTGFTRYITKG